MPAKKAAKKAATKAASEVPANKAAKKAAKKAPKAAAADTPAPPKPAKPAKNTDKDVAKAAYLNYKSRVEQGFHGDQLGDWLAAENGED